MLLHKNNLLCLQYVDGTVAIIAITFLVIIYESFIAKDA